MKHVTTFASDSVSVEDNITDNENDLHSKDIPILAMTAIPNSTIKVDKRNFQERCYGIFVQMAETVQSW